MVWLLIFVGIKFSWISLDFLFIKFHMHDALGIFAAPGF